MSRIREAYKEMFERDPQINLAIRDVRELLETLHKESSAKRAEEDRQMVGVTVLAQMSDGSIRVVRKGTFIQTFEIEMLHRLAAASHAALVSDFYQKLYSPQGPYVDPAHRKQ